MWDLGGHNETDDVMDIRMQDGDGLDIMFILNRDNWVNNKLLSNQ